LIIDPDDHLADNLPEIVALAGYEALTLSRSEDALSDVPCGSVDVILTDHRLRGMYGAGLMSKLRSPEGGAAIVFITARPEDDGGGASPDADGSRLVCGPIDVPRLLATLLALLGWSPRTLK
jgi:DNA-binding response OmpR family regulator